MQSVTDKLRTKLSTDSVDITGGSSIDFHSRQDLDFLPMTGYGVASVEPKIFVEQRDAFSWRAEQGNRSRRFPGCGGARRRQSFAATGPQKCILSTAWKNQKFVIHFGQTNPARVL
ncbi:MULTISPECIES: hypothetical protein [Methylococcus]|uniref:Uncharacterized protein n=1 Tax=Methylococcus capsulatus TaxID=414 RepID=A0ABZ2FA32_METCP|nr:MULTISPECIES: hypothetical protein [Methylococcus]MDF9391142.1 hypothetical protein [Methylococcus capsulatus]